MTENESIRELTTISNFMLESSKKRRNVPMVLKCSFISPQLSVFNGCIENEVYFSKDYFERLTPFAKHELARYMLEKEYRVYITKQYEKERVLREQTEKQYNTKLWEHLEKNGFDVEKSPPGQDVDF